MHDYQTIIFGYHENMKHHGTSLKTLWQKHASRLQMVTISVSPARCSVCFMNIKRCSVLMSSAVTNWDSVASAVWCEWWSPSDDVPGVWVKMDLIVDIHQWRSLIRREGRHRFHMKHWSHCPASLHYWDDDNNRLFTMLGQVRRLLTCFSQS